MLRGLLRLVQENDEFTILAAAGLLTGFGLQAFVNMASTLHLIPTKGMTLPFISYGGSSAHFGGAGHGHAAGVDPPAARMEILHEGPGRETRRDCRRRHRRSFFFPPRRWRPNFSRAATALC